MAKNKPLFKIAILSISLLCMAAPAVSATVPYIASAMSGVSQSSIEMLMSVPNFGILLFVFLSPFVARTIGNKKTVLCGLVITLIAGIVPLFTLNYVVLLASRFALGCGIGLFNSLAYSLISMYYTGKQRDRLLGYQAAVSSFGSTIFSLLVGWLMRFGWQSSYLIYLVALLPIILYGIIVPDRKTSQKESVETVNKEKVIIHRSVFAYAIYLFIIFASYMTIVFKLASQFVEAGYGTASQASVVLALMTATGFVSGLIFGKVRGLLKGMTAPLSVAMLGLMIVSISFSNSVILSGVLVALAGIFSGFINPSIFSEVASVSNEASQTAASTCLLIGINLGCFLNPTIFSIIGRLAGNQSVQFSLLAGGIVLIVCAVFHLVMRSMNKSTDMERKIQHD